MTSQAAKPRPMPARMAMQTAGCRNERPLFSTVLYNENTYRSVWRRRRPAPSDTPQWVCGEEIVAQIANPPDPTINAQREGAVRNAAWTQRDGGNDGF